MVNIMVNNKCPCKDCICVPVCKHKVYNILVSGCQIVKKELYFRGPVTDKIRRKRFTKSVVDVEKYLKPVLWRVRIEDNGYAHVIFKLLREDSHAH